MIINRSLNIFKISLIFLLLFLSNNISFAQQSIDSIINFTLSYRGLTLDDITIPVNFDKDKSPKNDSKLLLPIVKELMKEPMKSFGFIDTVNNWRDDNLETVVDKMFGLINYSDQLKIENAIIKVNNPDQLGNALVKFIKNRNIIRKELLKSFSEEELIYLNNHLMSLISESEDEGGINSDIFKFNQERDSSIKFSKNTLDILSKIDRKKIYSDSKNDFLYVKNLYDKLSKDIFNNYSEEGIDNKYVKGKFLFYYDEEGIRIAIGGKEKNVYSGHFDFIIDLGGDDVYEIENEFGSDGGKRFKPFAGCSLNCILDLSGNDFYSSKSNYSLAASVFSSGFIFDKEGDDTYKAKNVSLGSAVCGLGILYDESGNDIYQANQFSIGAASFGVGLLYDKNGNDFYIANSYSQGFGMTEGAGAILDQKGNDSYLIDARSLDIGRYEDHYVSMSQGYGLGLRPYYAGGVGLIIEGEGNDFYSTDIFGQGGAYWYALGCIADNYGNDKYNSYQYAQGAGIHLAIGLLKDYNGWDFYTSDGVSQGCGHDFGFGLLDDVNGNDNYSTYSLSQGAGNANGIGMFIDESGRDGYLNKQPDNTRGYGNSRREFGSLGIFLDAAGEDFYSTNSGMDSVISNSSMWGVMNDFNLKDPVSLPSGTNFKVPLDSISKKYSTEEYFIMAKTIEPRFSLWQEFGFRKLVEDSINTSNYILKYLDTDDHRAGLVLRNLAFKIGYTIGNLFVDKLQYHLTSMKATPVFNENQIAFICYLFGETRNPIGRNELLELTKDNNIRVKSSSINALGKIIIDTAESDFIDKASQRLIELANEKSQNKMLNKDIAYAFNNYKNENNIPALIDMMKYNYFGVRFIAAEDLKSFDDEYYNYLISNKNVINKIANEKVWFQAFLNSIENISAENFKTLFTILQTLNISEDEIIQMNYIDLLKYKLNLSSDAGFIQWLSLNIEKSQSGKFLRQK